MLNLNSAKQFSFLCYIIVHNSGILRGNGLFAGCRALDQWPSRGPCHISEVPQAKVGKMGWAWKLFKWAMKISLLK
jgi:hypothetical protein